MNNLNKNSDNENLDNIINNIKELENNNINNDRLYYNKCIIMNKIKKNNHKNRNNKFKVLSLVASILFILSASFVFFRIYNNFNVSNLNTNDNNINYYQDNISNSNNIMPSNISNISNISNNNVPRKGAGRESQNVGVANSNDILKYSNNNNTDNYYTEDLNYINLIWDTYDGYSYFDY